MNSNEIQSPSTNENTLILAGLRVSHPERQEGLIEALSYGKAPTGILNKYSSVNRLRCAVCRCDGKHNSGITLVFSDGTKALCGLQCAKKFFGRETILRIEKNFSLAERSIVLRKQLEPSLEAIDGAICILEAGWLNYEKEINEFRESFTLCLGSNALRFLCGQKLFYTDVVFERQISSLSFVYRRLKELKAELNKSTVSDKQISQSNISRLTIPQTIEERVRYFKFFQRFTEAENLASLGRWCFKNEDLQMSVGSNHSSILFGAAKRRPSQSIRLPKIVDLESLSSVIGILSLSNLGEKNQP